MVFQDAEVLEILQYVQYQRDTYAAPYASCRGPADDRPGDGPSQKNENLAARCATSICQAPGPLAHVSATVDERYDEIYKQRQMLL